MSPRSIAIALAAPVTIVAAFAVVNDAAYAEVGGHRYCLDSQVAAQSPDLTDQMCFTVGIDTTVPKSLRQLGQDVDRELISPLGATARRLWAAAG
ncbi:hypothetical protein [Nocardioides acrostichi]|uniref:Uncharacterized protein n=1 Tax=Nocardioides acrostichi TaxID=2784339 RepID=A0A930V1K4_9ACTN|nr:hypothetical protein [Nocardioides acrostichi]MBF4162359.1 hypothetical protein [Nocardioides acrostichi]